MRSLPDDLPILGRGRHRRPRDGACLMELVSVLAGERWSDSPRCTHPVLAHLARKVNDAVSDEARQPLAQRAAELAGLNGPDPLWELEIALGTAVWALPRAARADQDLLALGLLTCEELLTAATTEQRRRPGVADAVAASPHAVEWAAAFMDTVSRRRRLAPSRAVVELAVAAVGRSSASDPDRELVGLLDHAIATCAALQVEQPAPAPARQQALHAGSRI